MRFNDNVNVKITVMLDLATAQRVTNNVQAE